MAIRQISGENQTFENFKALENHRNIHQGNILAMDKYSNISLADRKIHKYNEIIGYAADNISENNNTLIQVDPIGYQNLTGGGFYSQVQGMIYSWDNTIRPYSAYSEFRCKDNFVLDTYKLMEFVDMKTDIEITNFNYGDILTYGCGENAGYFVKLSEKYREYALNIAKVTKYDSTCGLLYIEILYPNTPLPMLVESNQTPRNILDNLIFLEDL